jgi:hypothetical protein
MLVTTLLACATPVPGTYLGSLGNVPSQVGLVTTAAGGRAYVAGESDTMDHHHVWLDLKIDGIKLHAQGADRLVIDAKWEEDGWHGTLYDWDDSRRLFIAFPAASTKDDTLSGVYEAESDSVCPVGAIVSNNGKKLVGVYCNADETYSQLVPTTVDEDGTIVADADGIHAVTDDAAATEVVLTAAEP